MVECELAALCLQYLTFECFQPDLGEDQLRRYAESGIFAFQDYAAAKWIHHVKAILGLSPDTFYATGNAASYQAKLLTAFDDFTSTYSDELPDNDIAFPALEACSKFQGNLIYDDLTRVWNCILKHQEGDLDTRNTIIPPSLSRSVTSARETLQEITGNKRGSYPHAARLAKYYGSKSFKCPKVTCFYFHEGFGDAKSRDKHLKQHDRPFWCPVDDCSSAEFGFASNIQLDKHKRQYHADLCDPTLSFSMSKPTPEKTPFPCHLCDKKFTRKINLNSHLKNHTGEKPYECKECGKAFTRINDCRRHEKNIHAR